MFHRKVSKLLQLNVYDLCFVCRRAVSGLDEEPSSSSIHSVLSRLALLSVAYLVILPVQDILGLDDRSRFNLPGVDSPRNWTWKLSSLEPLYRPENLNQIREMLTISNRLSNHL